MDILLTDGQIKSAVVALADYPDEQQLEAYRKVAKAQLQKVVKWLESNNNANYYVPRPNGEWTPPVNRDQLVLFDKAWQFIREAWANG